MTVMRSGPGRHAGPTNSACIDMARDLRREAALRRLGAAVYELLTIWVRDWQRENLHQGRS
jgi:hypothetical protein